MTVKATKNKKSKRNKLKRTLVVSVRLDPKLHYLASLAARKQRRTLSSFIEWTVESGLDSVYLDEIQGHDDWSGGSVLYEAKELWDYDEAGRFVRLAILHVDQLTGEELELWSLICSYGYLWEGEVEDGKWVYERDLDSLVFSRLRAMWDDLNSIVAGGVDATSLSEWGLPSAMKGNNG